MDKLFLRYLYFCWWLDRLVRRITPQSEHYCLFHPGSAIRTVGRSGKICTYCHDYPFKEPMNYYQEDLMHSGPALYDVVVTSQGIQLVEACSAQ